MSASTEVCSLCSDVIYNNNFEVIDKCRTSMLKLIAGDLDMVTTCRQLICLGCSRNLQQSFEFKSACLSNDDYLKTFIHPSGEAKLCLEEIILRQTVILDGVKCEEEKVCRFCLRHQDFALFTKLNDIEEDIFLKDMMKKCLPEVDLEVTNNPLICLECMESLQNQFNFVINCFDSCEQLKSDLLLKASNVMNVKEENEMAKMDLKFVKMETESEVISDEIVIKQENEFEVLKESEFQVKIDDYVKLEEDAAEFEGCSQSKKQAKPRPVMEESYKGRYSCTKCSHQTNRKDSLELHYLTHEEPTNCQKFKCEHCDFTTKWKSSLTQHNLRHYSPSDMPTFQCAHCPYKAKYKKHLRRHSKRHMDTIKKKYICEYCTFKTGNRDYFKQHNKVKHKKSVVLEKESFKCEKCTFESMYKVEYDKHLKVKHNIAKYTCECGYQSQNMYNFRGHQLMHKRDDEVEMYSCDKCNFRSKYKESYGKHLKLHELKEKAMKVL